MAQVFISYSSRDRTPVRRLARDLRAHGVAVWLDESEIKVGDSISHAVERGLSNSDFLLLWLTKSALDSGWVDREWRGKLLDEVDTGRVLVLVALADETDVPGLLRDKKWADFRRSYEEGLAQILAVPGLAPLRIGDALYRGLHEAEELLMRIVRPIFGGLGDLSLSEPHEQRWYPYRPDSLAAWVPDHGTWRDHHAVLGICDIDGDCQPTLVFRWGDNSDPWPAIQDPYADPITMTYTLDGLLYVRAHARRLVDILGVRLSKLAGLRLAAQADSFASELSRVAIRFSST